MNEAVHPRDIVLIVDDSPETLGFLTDALEQSGFSVLIATSGNAAINVVDRITPDVILMDAVMPGMNGWQLVTRLRDHGQTAPVIMLSANIGDGTASDTHSGHNDTLAKPFDIRQLHDKLAVHLALEWIYGDTVQPVQTARPKRTMTNPGAAHVEELIRLGEIGYVRGIEAKLADLARLEENQPFTEAVKTYVQAFDLAGYADFLQNINKQGRPAGE